MTEVTSEPRVFMRHLRAAKICSGGARMWFPRHGFNYSEFLSDGIAGESLLATGDPFAQKALEQARIERDG